MNTSLIRKIIASDLPRREQDLLILLVIDSDQTKGALDDYYRENEPESSKTCEPSDDETGSNSDIYESGSESDISDNSLDCDDRGHNKAVRAEYEARHGRIMNGREQAAETSAQNSIKYDHSKAWGLQFPSHTIWGNWIHSYDK
jgi:hypothetical protein